MNNINNWIKYAKREDEILKCDPWFCSLATKLIKEATKHNVWIPIKPIKSLFQLKWKLI